MKTNEIKQALEKQGFKVKISHERQLNSQSPVKAGETANAAHIRGMDLSRFINGKGGITHVKLIKGKEVSYGRAECSIHDSYNKYEGFKIACNRALAEFGLNLEKLEA